MKASKKAAKVAKTPPAANAYVCRICGAGFVFPDKPRACPRCNNFNSLVEAAIQRAAGRVPVETAEVRVRPVIEQVGGVPQTVGFVKETKIDPADAEDKEDRGDRAQEIDELVFEDRELTLLSDIEPEELDRFPSHVRTVDAVLDGGLVAGGLILLAGEKGVGKTTLWTRIVMEHILHYKDTKVFLASGEEPLSRFAPRAARIGFTPKQISTATRRIGGCRLKNIEAVHDEAKKLNPTMIVYDSMPMKFLHPDVSARKPELHAVRVIEEMYDFCSSRGIVGIVVARLTQAGLVAGGENWLYDVDGAVLRMTRVYKPTKPPVKTKYVRVTCDKNRFGAEEVVGWLRKSDRGLLCVNRPKFLSGRPKKSSNRKGTQNGQAVRKDLRKGR